MEKPRESLPRENKKVLSTFSTNHCQHSQPPTFNPEVKKQHEKSHVGSKYFVYCVACMKLRLSAYLKISFCAAVEIRWCWELLCARLIWLGPPDSCHNQQFLYIYIYNKTFTLQANAVVISMGKRKMWHSYLYCVGFWICRGGVITLEVSGVTFFNYHKVMTHLGFSVTKNLSREKPEKCRVWANIAKRWQSLFAPFSLMVWK